MSSTKKAAPDKALRRATAALDKMPPAEAAAILGALQREAADLPTRRAAAELRLFHLNRGLKGVARPETKADAKPAAKVKAPEPEPPAAEPAPPKPRPEPKVETMDVEDPALMQLFGAMDADEDVAEG